ncbi:MAG: HAD family hydrolase [Bacteroidetes bacterium GWF2_38_335]|nr:MAG: HAD family hydrolase [Bacteroidetes bacterium GWF2_38_335]HBS85266.1 HAD family hydrolase [Bacteroidales bacterium]
MTKNIKVIAFDADDTLWVNEPYFQDAEKEFCKLLADFLPAAEISSELFKTEITNLEKYGYGVKGFMLSMIETAIRISHKKVSPETIENIINLGKSILEKPTELLDDVDFVLNKLKDNYRLILATKGDLLDQHRKLNNSGLIHHFHHIEIMNDKNESDYLNLLKRLEIKPEEFLMVGNSLKSDILPVISIGGQAVHIPYHTTWQHETIENKSASGKYFEILKMKEILELL